MMSLKRTILIAPLLTGLMALAACGQPSAGTDTAATEPAPAATTEPAPATATAAASNVATPAPAAAVAGNATFAELTGNAENGARVFRQCASCHSLEAGKNMVGPSLHGVIGRHSGTAPGFTYSAANSGSGITWTEEELFSYLENPRAKIPGTTMAYPGLRKPQDRADVIAYLKAN